MTKTTKTTPAATPQQIEVFRLQRHHLRDAKPADPVTIARDICGVQAQVMSAAYLQFWARNHSITKAEIKDLLVKSRKLVKTSLMRQTLHVIPADEFPLYISAQRSARVAGALRIMLKFDITPQEGDAVTALILDTLAAGPLARPAINAAIRPQVSKRVRNWMDQVWSILRIPFAEGLVCYGPEEGNQVTFVRSDQWLPKSKPVPETAAQLALLRKYLRAYGPANVHDFSHWAGLPMTVSRKTFADLKDELREITVSGDPCAILQEDFALLTRRKVDRDSVRLLPLFDPYLLAHAEKHHLVEELHYKRVYRNQGWISAVILIDGKIGGTWSYAIEGKKIIVQITPFKKLPKSTRSLLELEAASLSSFVGKELEMQHLSLAIA
jgi:uncharacterized protein YcaQ